MTVNPSGWRPSAPANSQGEAQTVTGNRALMLEETLIFGRRLMHARTEASRPETPDRV